MYWNQGPASVPRSSNSSDQRPSTFGIDNSSGEFRIRVIMSATLRPGANLAACGWRVQCLFTLALLSAVAGGCHSLASGPTPDDVSDNAGCSEDVSMAVDSKRTVHLIWTDNTPGLQQGNRWNQEILYSFKREGDTWSSPVNLSCNSGASRFPCLAVDREDRLHAVWQDCSPAGNWAIFYVSKSPGAGWSVPETISGHGGCLSPWVAVDGACDVHLIWLTGDYDWRIWYATRNKASGWSAPVAILPKPSNVWSQPKIACDGNGGVHVAWSGSDTLQAPVYVYYSYKAPGGDWLPWQPISLTGYFLTSEVSLAVDHSNNAHFVWIDHYKEHGCITYRERYADGTWSEVVPCSTITAEGPGEPLGLGVGPDDALHLVWSDYVEEISGTSLCYASKIGPSWENRRVLVKVTPNNPAVVVGSQGEVHVAYDAYVDPAIENTDIFYLHVEK